MVAIRELVENWLKEKEQCILEEYLYTEIRKVQIVKTKDGYPFICEFAKGDTPLLFVMGQEVMVVDTEDIDKELTEEEAKKIIERLNSWEYFG